MCSCHRLFGWTLPRRAAAQMLPRRLIGSTPVNLQLSPDVHTLILTVYFIRNMENPHTLVASMHLTDVMDIRGCSLGFGRNSKIEAQDSVRFDAISRGIARARLACAKQEALAHARNVGTCLN